MLYPHAHTECFREDLAAAMALICSRALVCSCSRSLARRTNSAAICACAIEATPFTMDLVGAIVTFAGGDPGPCQALATHATTTTLKKIVVTTAQFSAQLSLQQSSSSKSLECFILDFPLARNRISATCTRRVRSRYVYSHKTTLPSHIPRVRGSSSYNPLRRSSPQPVDLGTRVDRIGGR